MSTAASHTAVPHGYTLATWAAAALLARSAGVPATADVLLFLLGAGVAYSLLIALPIAPAVSSPGRTWAAGAPTALVASILASHLAGLLPHGAEWPAAGLVTTLVYFVALGAVLARRRARC